MRICAVVFLVVLNYFLGAQPVARFNFDQESAAICRGVLNLSTLENGLYFLVIDDARSKNTQRIILARTR